jgi:hypothetical protein
MPVVCGLCAESVILFRLRSARPLVIYNIGGVDLPTGKPEWGQIRPVSLQEIARLLRRHLAAVLAVLVFAGGVAYWLKSSPQPYEDGGTAVFTPPPSVNFPNPYSSLSASLIQTAGLVAVIVMSPQSQQQIRAAGGTGTYNVELVNKYNLEYPNFSDTDVTVTATGATPATASATFTVVIRQIGNVLASLESRAAVRRIDHIGVHVIGSTGPLSQQGSSVRVFAGLLFLTIVTVFAVAGFLDRHPFRPRRLPGFRRLAVGR